MNSLNLNIRQKILFLVSFLILIPILVMGVTTYTLMKKELENGLTSLLKTVGQNTKDSLEDFLLQRHNEIQLVAGSSTLRDDDPKKLNMG